MVFQQKLESEIKQTFEMLTNAIEAYNTIIDADYLLVGWSTSLNDFFYCHIEPRK